MAENLKFRPVENFNEVLTVKNESKDFEYTIHFNKLSIMTGNPYIIDEVNDLLRVLRHIFFPVCMLYAHMERYSDSVVLEQMNQYVSKLFSDIDWKEIIENNTEICYSQNSNTMYISLKDDDKNEPIQVIMHVDYNPEETLFYMVGFGGYSICDQLILELFNWTTSAMYATLEEAISIMPDKRKNISIENCIRFFATQCIEENATPQSQIGLMRYFVDEWMNREKDEITSVMTFSTHSPYILGIIKEMVMDGSLKPEEVSIYNFSDRFGNRNYMGEDIVTFDIFKDLRDLEKKIKSLSRK